MTTPTKSPRKGRISLSEATLARYDNQNLTLPLTRVEKQVVSESVGKRAMFATKEDSTETMDLTPRKARRRSMQPRKSILKPLDIANIRESQTLNFSSLASRRVSFATSAHVRMFQDPNASRRHSTTKGNLKPSASVPSAQAGRRSSTLQKRRSSIQNIASIAESGARFIVEGEGEGEASMEISDEDSEADESQNMSMVSVDSSRRESIASAMSEEDDDDDDDEADMDETGVYGVGMIRRASMAPADMGADLGDVSIMSGTSTGTDEERTMDFTVALGGVLPASAPAHAAKNRHSIGYSHPESPQSAKNRLRPGQSILGDSDASLDMEETAVYGTIVNADDTMSTISEQDSPNGRERTGTYNFGDLSAQGQGNQHAAGTDSEEEDGNAMEMTVAFGGIIQTHPAVSPGRPLSASTTSITHPSPAVGSYARPTLSSSQRSREPTPKKRNIFGPSPGADRPNTPRNGISTAGSVAKRLSFGSAGKKRAVDDDNESQNGSNKKARPTVTQNIFAPKLPTTSLGSISLGYKSSGRDHSKYEAIERDGSLPALPAVSPAAAKVISPVKYTTPVKEPQFDLERSINKPRDSMPRNLRPKSPRRSFGTPLRLVPVEQAQSSPNADKVNTTPGRMGKPIKMSVTPQSARKLLMKSPGKSPALRRLLGEHVPEAEIDEADDILDAIGLQHIPLADFMRMAKVEFMEDLPKVKRKSTVAQGLLGQPYTGGDRNFTLHEYAEAEVHQAFLGFYRWANDVISKDIEGYLQDIKEQEEICGEAMPTVMREYLAAEEDDRVMFEQTFQTYKAYTVLKAREKWYEWKMSSMLDTTCKDVEALCAGMEEDAVRLDELEAQADAVFPDLEATFMALQEELERERATVAEIAECDQDELAGLREAMAEQSTIIMGQASELEDANAKLHMLELKLNELEKTKKVCETRITAAKSLCDQYTRSDIVKFKEEFDSLQDLHLWRITAMRPDLVAMKYDDQLDLVVPCKDHVPTLSIATVSWNKDNLPSKDKLRYSPESTAGIFTLLEEQFTVIRKSATSLTELVQTTGSLVVAAQRLRAELGILNTRLPTTYRVVNTPSGRGLIVTSRLILKSVKSRVEISFLLLGEVLASWPGALADVEVEARTIYGSADPEIMKRAARETMSEIRDEAYVGALTQACFDAQGQYA